VEKVPKKLYSASEVASILGISRQALDQAIDETRLERNEYVTGEAKKMRGWTASQVVRMAGQLKKGRG
jgi:hypothetical protein